MVYFDIINIPNPHQQLPYIVSWLFCSVWSIGIESYLYRQHVCASLMISGCVSFATTASCPIKSFEHVINVNCYRNFYLYRLFLIYRRIILFIHVAFFHLYLFVQTDENLNYIACKDRLSKVYILL